MEAILFDWDGTLVDSLGALYRANLAVMSAFGRPYDEATYRATYQPDWRPMYRRLGVPEDRLDEANELWLAAYDLGSSSELFPGTGDALDRLSRTGVRLGLVTAGERSVVRPQLDRLGLAGRFTVEVFGDDHLVHKPDPAPLQAALRELGVADRPAAAAYVGDFTDDMRMARAAGTRAIGVASVLADRADLLAAGAHEVVASVAEWADRAIGIMLVDRLPRAPAV
jgi:HAD superfamily hydrolase (TIGR01549 family)